MYTIIHFIITTLQGTPLWVYALFTYLISLGIKNLKTQKISLYKLIGFPLFFLLWRLYALTKRGSNAFDYTIYLVALIGGIVLGYTIFSQFKTKLDRKKFEILVPGNRLFLILLIIIFFTKYFFWLLLCIKLFF